jgi:hypothetical protein
MTEAEALAAALALPAASAAPHFKRTAVRAGAGKIFATLGDGVLVVMLEPDHAATLLEAEPAICVANGWTKHGALGLRHDRAPDAMIEALLRTAWRRAAPKKLAATLGD